MPELPEVETVRKTLQYLLENKTIRDIDVFYSKMIRTDTIESFKEKLIGRTFGEINRVGKHLLFAFGEITLISHLRMEGKYYIKNLDDPRNKHEHIIFYFTDGSTLRYHDTRKFGTMDIVPSNVLFDLPPLSKMGLEPFHVKCTISYLKRKIINRKGPIKGVLLDQTVIAGLGNIYVDEVLFLSKIHPETLVHKLSDNNLQDILNNSRFVLNKAIELGGTTIRSYTSSLGVTGRFQNELFVHMRENEPCKICKTPIEKIKVVTRGTYVCPTCQKK
jgi:formamidopyrimidine-DNA glycosylase